MPKRLEDYATILKSKAGTTVLFEVPGIYAAQRDGLKVTMEAIHKARERKMRQMKEGIDEEK